MTNEDFDDPAVEAQWLAKQRGTVGQYLQNEGFGGRTIPANPLWFIAPCVAVWRIPSNEPAGLWVITGDLPTDYLRCREIVDARMALAAFAVQWLEVSSYMLRGERHPVIDMGPADQRRTLGDLLRRRAEVIADWAKDDEMWLTADD